VVGQDLAQEAYAADIGFQIFPAKAQVPAKKPNFITVKDSSVQQSTSGKMFPQSGGNRGFSGRRETSKPNRESLGSSINLLYA
jgi:hypothetical protein